MKKITIAAIVCALLIVSLVAATSHDTFWRLVGRNDRGNTGLVYKDAEGPNGIPGDFDDWTAEKNTAYGGLDRRLNGLVNYQVVSYDGVSLHGEFFGLKPFTEYQLKLNSYGAGFEAEALANACDEPMTGAVWQCGKWGEEGFLVLKTITTDRNGHFRLGRLSYNLPEGIYRVKFLITENAPPWTTPLMEEESLNFIVIDSTK